MTNLINVYIPSNVLQILMNVVHAQAFISSLVSRDFDRILTKGFRRPNRVARDMMGDVGTSNESNKSRLTSDSDIASEVLAPSDVVRTSNKST